MPLTPDTARSDAAQDYPAPAYAWYVVVVLTFGYVVSFLDRQIFALLIQPIREDLGLSDTQVSLVGGLAFALFYTLLGIPIGRLADRRSRRGLIAIGVTLWCLMTAACGLARNYWTLFLARVGVGVGEATLNPAALSLISDYFPRHRRGQAISFYNMGVGLGVGIANIVGAWAISVATAAPAMVLPGYGPLQPWQLVFMFVGLPGLLVALLMFTVREPPRRDRLRLAGADGTVQEQLSVADALRFLGARWKTYATHFVGMSVVTIIGYALFFWVPTMFVRSWGWTIPESGYAYGLITLVCGPLGVNLGGWIADRLYARGMRDGLMRTSLFAAALVFVPASVIAPLMPTAAGAVLFLIPSSLAGAAITATGVAALMMITPNQLRGQVTALYYFVLNALGLTIGPTAVALITDYGFGDPQALRYSLAVVGAGAGILALGFLATNLRLYRAAMLEAEGWDQR
ncbi:MAG: MFS transporter [Gammaproteobacteria bacterium]|nr:MAG: MFS transporter [Gammaproteobacteria bacterium]